MKTIYCSLCHQPCDLIRYKSTDYEYSSEWVIKSKCCNGYVENSMGVIIPYESLVATHNFYQSFEVSGDDENQY